ncbi:amino acid permease [Aliikangiella coralliicola]|uniref:Arginine/agmatine antiporter n=1 Tax=Aliikangiella coralliicola TaxID=2592383 RepID=A0A545TS25_9GAMM|nr:amino acid permease [Aliikangiella coralliicola]TQV80012.1 amino acid permease [Aliikangiella coralliicola]
MSSPITEKNDSDNAKPDDQVALQSQTEGVSVVSDKKAKNKKTVGIWICSALVIGNMIGSGIFLLPASLAPYGGVSILGWLATTFGALMTALVFVRLSRKFPKQGGPYRYAYDNFGSLAAFCVAWSYWVSIWCGNSAIAVAAIAYLSFFFPELQSNPVYAVICALVLIWSVTLINIRGVKQAGIFQLVTTVLKLLPLLAIGAAAFFVFEPQAFRPFNLSEQPIVFSVTATAALTLWAFLGLESATIPADNVDNPKVTIPRATMLGFGVAAVIYISSQIAIMSAVPNEQLQSSGAPFADAAKIIWGEWAGYMVAIGAVISCVGALNGWILLQGQVPMTAARDGLLPAIFKDKDNQGVSISALVLSSGLISVLVIANFSEGMVSLFTFAILISTLGIFIPYLLSIGAELKWIFSRWRTKPEYFNLLTATFALGYCCWAVSGIGVKSLLWGVALIVGGLPIYFVMTKNK